jgi:predicted DNA-binding protein (MmcQ/YjbR family)
MASTPRSVKSSISKRKTASQASKTSAVPKRRKASTAGKAKPKTTVGKLKPSSTQKQTSSTATRAISSSKSSPSKAKTAAVSKALPENNSKSRADMIRKAALSFPETSEDFPWGHSAFKVKNKTFCWMSFAENGMRLTLKLTESRFHALSMPSVEESNYGLGKHGWVTAFFTYEKDFPIDMLKRWLDESFRAVAPKAISKLMPPMGTKRRSSSDE